MWIIGVKGTEHLQGKIGVTLSLRWRKLNHLQVDYLYDCGMTKAYYCYITGLSLRFQVAG